MSQPKRDWRSQALEGVFLRFLVHENRLHRHKTVYLWLLEEARRLGIHGGSAYRGIAGYGRHGVFHEAHFFELAGDLPVEIRFVCSETDAYRLLDRVEEEELSLFFVICPTHYGIAGAHKDEWARLMLPGG